MFASENLTPEWKAQCAGLRRRMNFGWWLAVVAKPLMLGGFGGMGGLFWLRAYGKVDEFWGGWGIAAVALGIVAGSAGWAYIVARKDFHDDGDAAARLDQALGLGGALLAAGEGKGRSPLWRGRVANPLRWRWGRAVAPLVIGVAMLLAGVFFPVPDSAVEIPAAPPVAWDNFQKTLDAMKEDEGIAPDSLEKYQEEIDRLKSAPEGEWYSHASLEAGERVRDALSNDARMLEHNLKRVADALDTAAQRRTGDDGRDGEASEGSGGQGKQRGGRTAQAGDGSPGSAQGQAGGGENSEGEAGAAEVAAKPGEVPGQDGNEPAGDGGGADPRGKGGERAAQAGGNALSEEETADLQDALKGLNMPGGLAPGKELAEALGDISPQSLNNMNPAAMREMASNMRKDAAKLKDALEKLKSGSAREGGDPAQVCPDCGDGNCPGGCAGARAANRGDNGAQPGNAGNQNGDGQGGRQGGGEPARGPGHVEQAFNNKSPRIQPGAPQALPPASLKEFTPGSLSQTSNARPGASGARPDTSAGGSAGETRGGSANWQNSLPPSEQKALQRFYK